MLTTNQIQSLKAVNVCKDPELTKARFKEDFSSATNVQKTEIVEMTGQIRASFYRVYNTGTANAKLVLSMAQVLKVSPFYYTGELDERQELDNVSMIRFLKRNGYTDLALDMLEKLDDFTEMETEQINSMSVQISEDVQRNAIQESDIEAESDATQDSDTEVESDKSIPSSDNRNKLYDEVYKILKALKLILPDKAKIAYSLSDEELTLLLQSLLIRSRTGGTPELVAELVKLCLVF